MASEHTRRILELTLPAATALTLALALPATAADTDKARIYRCEVDGKKVTRDRPIPECRDKVQYLLNADGSVNREIPPTLTVEEREKKELADLAREIKESRIKQDIRADRGLLQLYPNEEAHRKARAKALEEVHLSLQKSEDRIKALNKERKPIVDETEFYVGKALPMKVKAALDANDASLAAQKSLIQNLQSEIVRITATYDVEFGRLRKLWAGAAPGSLGPLPGTQAPAQPTAITAGTPDAGGKTTVK